MLHENDSKQPLKQTLKTFESTVKIIGDYPPLKKTSSETHIETLNFDPNAKSFIPNNIANSLINKSIKINSKVKINPVKVTSEGQTIGIIDQNSNAWILSEIFQSPVNISLLIKKRVSEIFINEKQAILKTKKGLILINWGSKKLFDNKVLVKIPIFDSKNYYEHFFEAFSILDGSPDDFFMMSNIKKVQNSNKMYRITSEGTQVIGYPTLQKFQGYDSKVIGVSVGKYHVLCWDEMGKIYSWGSRSLALGFDNLPEQDLITQPTRLNFNFLVKTAFASNHYSLALSLDGKLYEWGVKRQVNQINEELIFEPRVLTFKYFNCSNKKFTTLKGKNEKYGIISTTGQMYVWGQKTRIFIHPNASVPRQWQNGRLYEPYLVHIPSDDKIIDFAIEQSYLSLILIPKTCKYHMKQETQYWNNVVTSVRNKFQLRKYRKIETQGNQSVKKKTIRIHTEAEKPVINQPQNIKMQPATKRQLSNRSMTKSQNSFRSLLKSSRDDKISRAQNIKKSKQKYFQMAKSEEKLFHHIMKPLKTQKTYDFLEGQIPLREYKKSHTAIALSLNLMKSHTKKNSIQEGDNIFSNFLQSTKQPSALPQYLKDLDSQKIQQIKKKRRQQHKKLLLRTSSDAFTKRKTEKKSYTMKLQQVLEKKKQLQIQNFNQTVRRLQENSLQHRMKRHQQLQILRERQQNKELLKNTLCKFLIKNYIVKMFGSPLSKGRQIKIENFARNLKFQRIEKNIRKVFIKAKVKFGLKKLQSLYFSRFALLTLMWRRYVKRFRQRKYRQNRCMIIQQVMKFFVKDKIKLGLSTSNMNVRKIQKFRQWLALVKNQRMKCLKFLWKAHIMGIMKVNPENQNMVVSHFPKNFDQISFQTLYMEKVQQNPNLKLETFLNKSPLFKIKVQYFKTVANLFTEEKKPLHRSQKIINYLTTKKKTKIIKFFDNEPDQQKETLLKLNVMTGDIYPYSLHYNFFTRPKNYDVSLSQLMRKSQKWVKQQKQILQKILNDIIYKHQKVYLKRSLEYDLQLAKFIRDKYDFFSQKRWKFIIEYNKIQRKMSDRKRQKELYRLLDLIGMKKLLEQDCIPEKHVILQEALKRKDAPKPPNHFIMFGQKQFKQAFKLYFDLIHLKAKQIKKLV